MHKAVLFIIGVLLFILVIIVFNFNFGVILNASNPLFLVLAFFVFIFSLVVLSFRTRYLIESAYPEKLGFGLLLKIEFVSKIFFYLLPGRFNIPAKAILLSTFSKTTKRKALSVMSLEYVLDISVMIFLALVGGAIFLQNILSQVSIVGIIISVVILLLLAVSYFLIPLTFFDKLKMVAAHFPRLVSRIVNYVISVALHIREYWPKMLFNNNIFFVLLFILFGWVLNSIAMELLFLAYGSYVPIIWVLTISAFSIFIAGISQIPGGIGARELSLVVLFVSLGVPESQVVAVSIVMRIFTIAPIIIGYYFLSQLKLKNQISLRELVKMKQ